MRFCIRSVVALLAGLFSASAAPEIISVNPAGFAGGTCSEPTISSDGNVVAFSTFARLLPTDRNAISDVYARNRATGKLRLVSDDRGGDQPIVSANGRYVVFRSLERFPKLRVVDLDRDDPPRTISFPNDTGFSFRYADTATITGNGRFIAFPFRPIPGFTNQSNVSLYVVDTTVADTTADAAAVDITAQFPLDTLGRGAMSADGNRFFVETRDRVLPGADKNSAQDIYLLTRGSTNVVMVSFVADPTLKDAQGLELGAEASKGARDPVTTPDGNTVYFISDRRLVPADNDRHASLYRARQATGFFAEWIPTPGFTPISLSRQATGDGQYVTFLGVQPGQPARAYVLQVATGKVLARSGPAAGVPALAGDNSIVALVTTSSFQPKDVNSSGDVYLGPTPFEGATLAAPTLNLTVNSAGEIVQGTNVQIGATASSANAAITQTTIEIDGNTLFSSTTGNIPSTNVALPAGTHRIRAFTMDAAGVTKYSTEVPVIVKPSANSVSLRGVKNLVRTGLESDGEINFSGAFQIDNTFATAQGPLRVLLTEAPSEADWEFFGGLITPTNPENILDVLLLDTAGNLAVTTGANPSTPSEIPFSSITRRPEILSTDGFDGVGYTVFAQLQKFSGSTWSNLGSPLTVFQVRPRLSEQTPGPNGGTPILETPDHDAGFNPTQVTALTINGPAVVAEFTARTFSATATFTNASPATRPITPRWSLVSNPGGRAVFSAAGVLSTRDVAVPTKVKLRAAFANQTKDLDVTILPVPPVVSVLARPASVSEGSATPAAFRILRSQAPNQPLTVNFTVSGTANDPNRFPSNDYVALPQFATIPARTAFVDVPVQPTNDTTFEGNESVIMTLSPDGEYRLGVRRSATVTITEDDPVPNGQPDAVIRLGARPPVGANVYDFDGTVQQISTGAIRNVPVTFVLQFANRGTVPEDISFDTAGGDFLGFTVRFFMGRQDVTTSVQDGSLKFTNVQPGAAVQLTLRITATAATPLQGVVQCPVRVTGTVGGTFGGSDTIQAEVRRVR